MYSVIVSNPIFQAKVDAAAASRKKSLYSRQGHTSQLRQSRLCQRKRTVTPLQVCAVLPHHLITEVSDPVVLSDQLNVLSDQIHHAANHVFTLADIDASAVLDAAEETSNLRDDGWIAPISGTLKTILEAIAGFYDSVGISNSAGWSIMTLTLFTKLLTFPLAKTEVESRMAQSNLSPMIEAIKARYGDDKKKIQRETMRIQEEMGVNPLAGCLPSAIQLPVFLGLYRALVNASLDDDYNQPFFFIPNLAGPTEFGSDNTIGWLWPLIDGQPPIGSWDEAIPYLIVPGLVVIAQFLSMEILTPKDQEEPEQGKWLLYLIKLLPLFLGWFALNVPAGLTLYWLANSIITTSTQYYLKFLGGADPVLATKLEAPKIKLGNAIRSRAISKVAAPGAKPVQTVDLVASIDVEGTKTLNQQLRAQAAEEAEVAAAAPVEGSDAISGMFAGDGLGIDSPFESSPTPAAAPEAPKKNIKFQIEPMDPNLLTRTPRPPPERQGPPIYMVEVSAIEAAVQVAAEEARESKKLVQKQCKRKRNPEERLLVAPIVVQ